MNDPTFPDRVAPLLGLSVDARADPAEAALEKRVQRLEEAVASLEDTRALEDRITVRVTQRLEHVLTPGTDHVQEGHPAATPAAKGPEPTQLPVAVAPQPATEHRWLLTDLLSEFRLIGAMLFDNRFSMALTTHLVVWIFLPLILTSSIWFPLAYVPLIGIYFDKLLDLLLAFCVYKALSREARKYRASISPPVRAN